MPTSVPDPWLPNPPQTLLIGDGPYARSLAFIIGGAILPSDDLLSGVEEPQEGGLPQVFGSLERVIFVAGAVQSGSDLLRWHRALWIWIEKLSPEGEQHEVALLFVLPDSSVASLEESLAVGLGLKKLDSASGHGVVRMGDSMESLLGKLSAICPLDLPPLRARQTADAARVALHRLGRAHDPADIRDAASKVLTIFSGREYHLDLFCRPPSHRNGNLLRGWLRAIVTDGVTPDSVKEGNHLAEWLADLEGDNPI